MNAMNGYSLSPTQIGAIAEALVASGLMQASGGRLAPFRPVADDDGIDLLMYDKATGNAIPLQVKSRTGTDGSAGTTVQFDLRLSTFRPDGKGYLLAVLMKDGAPDTLWLIPMADLPGLTRRGPDRLVMVASPSLDSRDRYSPYRCSHLQEVSGRLVRAKKKC